MKMTQTALHTYFYGREIVHMFCVDDRGALHHDSEPAVLRYQPHLTYVAYYRHGQLHREGGHALCWEDALGRWWAEWHVYGCRVKATGGKSNTTEPT